MIFQTSMVIFPGVLPIQHLQNIEARLKAYHFHFINYWQVLKDFWEHQKLLNCLRFRAPCWTLWYLEEITGEHLGDGEGLAGFGMLDSSVMRCWRKKQIVKSDFDPGLLGFLASYSLPFFCHFHSTPQFQSDLAWCCSVAMFFWNNWAKSYLDPLQNGFICRTVVDAAAARSLWFFRKLPFGSESEPKNLGAFFRGQPEQQFFLADSALFRNLISFVMVWRKRMNDRLLHVSSLELPCERLGAGWVDDWRDWLEDDISCSNLFWWQVLGTASSPRHKSSS